MVPLQQDGQTIGGIDHDLMDDPPIALDASVRPILERMMMDGADSDEREALYADWKKAVTRTYDWA